MTVDAAPTVTVAGVTAGASAASSADVVAVEALSVTWGRGTLLDQPTPARASLTLLDRSSGRTFGTRDDLIGQLVVIAWTGSGGGSGTCFRGRVTDAEVSPVVRRDAAGMLRRMLLVSIAATSIELDAANYLAPAGSAWPAESLDARQNRIAGLMPAGLFASVTHDSWLDTGACAAMDVSGKSALELLQQLSQSTCRPLVYDPSSNGLTFVGRRFWTAGFTTALEPVAELGGAYAVTASPAAGAWLPAHRLAPLVSARRELSSRITYLEIKWLLSGAAQSKAATIYTTAQLDEAVYGRRSLSIDTCLGDEGVPGRSANSSFAEWSTLCRYENSRPRLEPVTWRSAHGWWDTAAQRSVMLAGREQATAVFLQGSWLPEVGMPPLVGFVGGVIGYAAGEWSIQLTPVGTFHNVAPGPLQGRYVASSTAVRAVDLDASVTFGDCAHIQIGAGYTAATMPAE